MPNHGKAMPPSVVRRLTRYYAQVQDLRAQDVEWVSSQELADTLGLTSSTVRQDLSHVDFSGISKRGYETVGLESVLSEVLGVDTVWKTVVVGAGRLGMALALFDEFPRSGFRICGVFDSDPEKVGCDFGDGLSVQGMDALAAFVKRRRIDIGIIAVPAVAAQEAANGLVIAGVRGLLNLAYTHITTPDHVSVVDARILESLQELSHAIKSQSGA
jgi:redox-sensing transcriptional repressor